MPGTSLFDLSHRVAIVTGGGSGIGRAVALGLATSGADVIVADIDFEHAQSVANQIQGLGRQALPLRVDVTLPEQVEKLVGESVASFGSADILVNAAGINIRRPAVELAAEEIERVLRVNLFGVLHCCRTVGRHMVERQRGSIVNLSSIMGTIAAARSLAYITSKGGVSQLTRALAVEWATTGVRVNAVAPGYCRTPLIDQVIQDPDWVARIEQRTPMGRLAHPEEIVGPVVFLASDAASYVTGTILYVDGGYTAA